MNLFITNSRKYTFKSSWIYNAIFLLIVILGLLFLSIIDKTILPKYLANRLSHKDYLSSLQHPQFGVHVYPYKNIKIDYLTIGDSHVYSGINYNLFSEMLQTENIGSFSVGGLRLESSTQLFSLMDKFNNYPQNIILGVSLLMFMKHEDNINRMNEMEELVEGLINHKYFNNIRRENLLGLFLDILGLKTYYSPFLSPINYSIQKEKLKYHAPLISALSDSSIERNFTVSSSLPLYKLYSQGMFVENIEDIIENFCLQVKKRNIKLYVIHIPESPLIEKEYPPYLFSSYKKYLKGFEDYAEKVIIKQSKSYNIFNKHYINRYLKKVNYDNWNEIDINYDHLNYYGSTIFTDKALSFLDLVSN